MTQTVAARTAGDGATPPTMVPAPSALPDVLPTDRLTAKGVARRPWRDELRRIPTARNVVAVAGAVLQTYGVVVAAAIVNTWWSWLAAFVWMGRGHALLNILAHEAAHRLLFANRTMNDQVGRWVLGYPTLQPFYVYRRVHFAHHRDELGPDEPDTDLYRGYPIPKQSWRRKLRRDATGRERLQEPQGARARRPQAGTRGIADPRRAGRARSASPLPPIDRSPTSCGSVRGARCGSCPTDCGRSPSTAGWSAAPIGAEQRTSSANRRSPACAWCRTTPGGTSPTMSTWACRGATCRDSTPSS